MKHRITAAALATIAAGAMLVVAPAIAGGKSASRFDQFAFGIDGNNGRFEARANLSGAGLASGKAVYKERLRGALLEQRFSVEVEDAAPGDVLEVAVNGVAFGMIVVNGLGIAELEWRNVTNDPGVGPLPPGFPRIQGGETITVGALSGTFIPR